MPSLPLLHDENRMLTSREMTPGVEPTAINQTSNQTLPVAVGAVAMGAVAIDALAIGRLVVGQSRIRSLEIEELTVRRLRVEELVVEQESRGTP